MFFPSFERPILYTSKLQENYGFLYINLMVIMVVVMMMMMMMMMTTTIIIIIIIIINFLYMCNKYKIWLH